METQLVVPGVHLLPFEIGQAYVWQWGDNLTIIDTGITGSASTILEAIGAVGRRPEDVREIVLTHFHPDHCGGAVELVQRTGAKVIAHRADAPVIRGEQAGAPPVLTEAERPLADAIFPRVPPAQPVDVNREVGEGDTTEGGGRIVDAPGHTPGSLALLLPGQSVLFTGDCIACAEGKPILGPFNIDRSASMASARKLAELGCEVACFGHGPPLVGDASRKLRTLADPLGSGPTGSQGSANP
jgi:glyoxylase-like metal-dependent hydrolase (beta-lactamase superfamily II)